MARCVATSRWWYAAGVLPTSDNTKWRELQTNVQGPSTSHAVTPATSSNTLYAPQAAGRPSGPDIIVFQPDVLFSAPGGAMQARQACGGGCSVVVLQANEAVARALQADDYLVGRGVRERERPRGRQDTQSTTPQRVRGRGKGPWCWGMAAWHSPPRPQCRCIRGSCGAPVRWGLPCIRACLMAPRPPPALRSRASTCVLPASLPSFLAP